MDPHATNKGSPFSQAFDSSLLVGSQPSPNGAPPRVENNANWGPTRSETKVLVANYTISEDETGIGIRDKLRALKSNSNPFQPVEAEQPKNTVVDQNLVPLGPRSPTGALPAGAYPGVSPGPPRPSGPPRPPGPPLPAGPRYEGGFIPLTPRDRHMGRSGPPPPPPTGPSPRVGHGERSAYFGGLLVHYLVISQDRFNNSI